MRTVKHENDSLKKDDKDFFESRYYIWNKRAMCIHGQWPYMPVREQIIRCGGSILLALTMFIPLARKMFDSWGNNALFFECAPPAVTCLGCMMKMIVCVLFSPTLKKCLDKVRSNWENISNPHERKILEKYGEKGRAATTYYLILTYITISGWVLPPLVPKVMDAILPLNETRPNYPVFHSDYGVDPDVYFYPILIHGCLLACFGALMITGVDMLYMSMAQHFAGMFEILRYRLENMIPENKLTKDNIFNPDIQDDICYRQIISCINVHQQILRFVDLISSTLEWPLILIIFLGVVTLSVTGTMIVAPDVRTQDAMRFGLFGFAQVVHIFCATLPGHWIMSASAIFRDSCYGTRWYNMSRRTRRLILIMLRKTSTPCTIVAGKIYVMSMENLSNILKTTVSYCALLTSVQ